MEGYGSLNKIQLIPSQNIEYCFNFEKCNERTNERTDGQKYLCIELRYAQLIMIQTGIKITNFYEIRTVF